jgi:hypothetical protein
MLALQADPKRHSSRIAAMALLRKFKSPPSHHKTKKLQATKVALT